MAEVRSGDVFAVSSVDELGEGFGFRKVRQELGVESMGANVIVLPPRYMTNAHYHDIQEELYVVLSGTLQMEFGDGTRHELGPGGLARVSASASRRVINETNEPATYLCVGAKDGYVGRDGHVAGDEDEARARPLD
jgi:uncharacterized cupin superfamily protein